MLGAPWITLFLQKKITKHVRNGQQGLQKGQTGHDGESKHAQLSREVDITRYTDRNRSIQYYKFLALLAH